MSLPIDLTAKVGPQGWNLFSCCLPKSDAPMKEQEHDTSETVEGEPKSRDMGLELDLPELGDDPLPQHARTTDESNTIMAFWQFMISFVLFKFLGMRNDRKAIKSDPEKKDLPGTEEVKEEEQPIVTTDIVPIPEAVTVSFD